MFYNSEYLLNHKEFEDTTSCKINKFAFYELIKHAEHSPMCNTMSDFSRKYFYNMFIPSKGKLPLAINNIYRKYKKNHLEASFKPTQEIINIYNNLNVNGYYVKENFLNEEQVECIRNELNDFDYYSANKKTIKAKLSKIKSEDSLKKISTYHSMLNGKIIEANSYIYKLLINNDFFSQISNFYFKSKSYLNMLVSFYSNPITKDELQDGNFADGLNYHIDYSHLRFLKFFIYLTDVDTVEKGSHSLIKKTHEDKVKYPTSENDFLEKSIKVFPNKQKGGVIKNSWIKNNFEDKDIINFNKKKGALMIENTTALHKGNYCFEGNREMISLVFSISNICPHLPKNSVLVNTDSKNNLNDYKSYCIKDFSFFHEKEYLKKNNLKNKILFKLFSKI